MGWDFRGGNLAYGVVGADRARGRCWTTLAQDFWTWRAAEMPVSTDDIPRLERPADGSRIGPRQRSQSYRSKLLALSNGWQCHRRCEVASGAAGGLSTDGIGDRAIALGARLPGRVEEESQFLSRPDLGSLLSSFACAATVLGRAWREHRGDA